MKFNEILKKYRADEKITVPAMAKILGVPQRTLECWLSGERVPDAFKQAAIKNKLGIIE